MQPGGNDSSLRTTKHVAPRALIARPEKFERYARAFLTEIVKCPVLAISSGLLLIVHVLFSIDPSRTVGKSKEANCPASQNAAPLSLRGAGNWKVSMSCVSLRRPVHCKRLPCKLLEAAGSGL